MVFVMTDHTGRGQSDNSVHTLMDGFSVAYDAADSIPAIMGFYGSPVVFFKDVVILGVHNGEPAFC